MKKIILNFLFICLFYCFSMGQEPTNFYQLVYNHNQESLHEDDSSKVEDDEFERAVKIWGPRLWPSGNFTVAARAMNNYVTKYNSTNQNLNSCGTITPHTWESLGPNDMPSNHCIGGCISPVGTGAVGNITFDPYYGISNSTMYCCAQYSGLWKSTDSGLNWSLLNTDYLPFTSVGGVAIDKINSNNLYLITFNP